jgi:hypothetical protein
LFAVSGDGLGKCSIFRWRCGVHRNKRLLEAIHLKKWKRSGFFGRGCLKERAAHEEGKRGDGKERREEARNSRARPNASHAFS